MVEDSSPGEPGGMETLIALAERWRLLAFGPFVIGLAVLGGTYLITPVFTARTVFLPPQQQQSAAASALASIGGLSSLVGGAAQRTPADQYVALVLSTSLADRLVDKYKLLEVYDKDLRQDARKELAKNTRAVAGKRDGLIVVEVDDTSAQRAADIANSYVEELRTLTNRLALTEAQQRRMLFEGHLQRARDGLTKAQQVLQSSGFNQDSLKAEPKAAAEGYARLKAEITTTEARLETLRRNLTDSSPEVQQLAAALGVLRGQLARLEATVTNGASADYVSKYREFKYQEVLFEQFARQYELARVDESREGLLQVVDKAQAPEKKSWPPRALLAVAGTVGGFILLLAYVLGRHRWRQSTCQADGARQVKRLRTAFGRR